MIDVCIAAFANYPLLQTQLRHWDRIEGDHRLLVCDNTPECWRQTGWLDLNHRSTIEVYRQDFPEMFDGVRHGMALDYLVRKTKTPIIGICDTDFFWLDPRILSEIQHLFGLGFRCVGTELWYPGFEVVNQKYPERAGWKAPCVFGMFLDRELALSETFVTTPEEGQDLKETGWRLRKKIIDEDIRRCTYRSFQWVDKEVVFYGNPNDPIGVHLLKGSSSRGDVVVSAYHAALELVKTSQ